MEKLWAPWRLQYIQKNEENQGCVFCKKLQESADRDNLLLYRGTSCFVVLNLFPYNNGHLLVIPNRHVSDMNDLNESEDRELWKLTRFSKNNLAKAFRAEGFNIGMNCGRSAGAGIDAHLHMHIVPRWNGDTNFMPILGDTKVISQGLVQAYDQLYPYFHDSDAIR
jgi:ATP adenylyltransferase